MQYESLAAYPAVTSKNKKESVSGMETRWAKTFRSALEKTLVDYYVAPLAEDGSRAVVKKDARNLLADSHVEFRLTFMPFLPIHKLTLFVFSGFGSLNKGKYPIKAGLIDCILSSLLIACLFRQKEDLFQDRSASALQKRLQELVHDENISPELQKNYVDSIVSQSRIMEMDENLRFGEKEKWTKLFADVLNIKDVEVEKFADLLFFEPAEFGKKVAKIEWLFVRFFEVYAEALQRRKPVGFNKAVKKLLVRTEKRIVREVAEFYKNVKDAEITQEEIKKYWSARVILEVASSEKRREEIALRSEEGISPEKLAEMSGDYIASATTNFRVWPEQKKTTLH